MRKLASALLTILCALLALSVILSFGIAMKEARQEAYIEETFFNQETDSHILIIQATSPEKLQEVICARSSQWQIKEHYQIVPTKKSFYPYRANLVAKDH